MKTLRRLAIGLMVKIWQGRDPVKRLPMYVPSMDPADNVQQAMNLIIPLKDPTPVGRAMLVEMLMGQSEAVIAGLHNTGIVHFARFTIVGDNLVMFSVFDGDFENYIRDFIYNIGSFFDGLMEHTTNPSPTPVESHPEEFVDWVKSVDAMQLGEDITAISNDLENLPRRLVLTMASTENLMIFIYRAYAGFSVAQVRDKLRIGW